MSITNVEAINNSIKSHIFLLSKYFYLFKSWCFFQRVRSAGPATDVGLDVGTVGLGLHFPLLVRAVAYTPRGSPRHSTQKGRKADAYSVIDLAKS